MYKHILTFACLCMAILFFVSCADRTNKEEQLRKHDVVVENILNRKSVREYKDQKVEKDKIDLMLRAGMAAPSGKDIRPWEFIVVNDRATLDSLAAGLPYAKMLPHTHQAIIVCGDSARSFYWYLDCSAATQNILLTAESLGLGAVWTAAYPYDDRMDVVRRHIGLPENILPLCVIPFGYPAKPNNPKDKYDETRIHYNSYQAK